MKLSENFNIDEFLVTTTGLPNDNISLVQKENIKQLVLNVMQPVRSYLKKPIIILSGFRNEAINKKVGGVVNSQHLSGEACDFTCKDIEKAYLFIKTNLVFDQLKYYKERDFIHVSYKHNRQQDLL